MEVNIVTKSETPRKVINKKIIILSVAIVLILLIGGIWYSLTKELVPEESAQNLQSALEKASIETPTAPSANPLEKVAPTGNPIEKTNPFNNEYQNPFE